MSYVYIKNNLRNKNTLSYIIASHPLFQVIYQRQLSEKRMSLIVNFFGICLYW